MECVVFYCEKQVSVARCQLLQLFSNVFIQVLLSLLGVNKTLWHGAVSRIALVLTRTVRSWKGVETILFHSTLLSKWYQSK